MDNNARANHVHVVDRFLESGDTERKSWPSKSPNLNQTETLWDFILKVVTRGYPLTRNIKICIVKGVEFYSRKLGATKMLTT